MLKLKKLQILGFKSFCDRTDLRFKATALPPLSAQRLRQVEHLRRHLLGSGRAVGALAARRHMQDVIFAGTRDRKPTAWPKSR